MKIAFIFCAMVAALALLFLLPFVFPLLILMLAALTFVFWIWMLIEAIQNKGLSDGEKICWVLAIVFMHFIGSVLYFFIGHPKRHMQITSRLGDRDIHVV